MGMSSSGASMIVGIDALGGSKKKLTMSLKILLTQNMTLTEFYLMRWPHFSFGIDIVQERNLDIIIRSSQIVDIWDIFRSPANAPEVRS